MNLTGTTGNDTIDGTTDDDYITGGAGDDTISGGDGNDRIDGRGPYVDNSNFDLDLTTDNGDGPVGTVPFWDVEGGGEALVFAENGNGILRMSNGGIAGAAGNSSVSQETDIVYTAGEDYDFTTAYSVIGSALPTSNIQLEIYVKSADGTLTLIADSGEVTIYNGADAAGYASGVSVTTADDGVGSLPPDLEGNIVVKITQLSGVAGSEPLVITDTSLSTTDPLALEDGSDTLDGGAGDDLILGDGGDDIISGGDDNDQIIGGAGDDNITGDAGDDVIAGTRGDDTIDGGDGNDVIFGDGYNVNPPENGGTFFGGAEANDWTISTGPQGDHQVDETTGALFLDTNVMQVAPVAMRLLQILSVKFMILRSPIMWTSIIGPKRMRYWRPALLFDSI